MLFDLKDTLKGKLPNKFIHEVNNLLERIIVIKSNYSGVISPLMQPSKWVQSIECGGD